MTQHPDLFAAVLALINACEAAIYNCPDCDGGGGCIRCESLDEAVRRVKELLS
jgi:hypothetical protein